MYHLSITKCLIKPTRLRGEKKQFIEYRERIMIQGSKFQRFDFWCQIIKNSPCNSRRNRGLFILHFNIEFYFSFSSVSVHSSSVPSYCSLCLDAFNNCELKIFCFDTFSKKSSPSTVSNQKTYALHSTGSFLRRSTKSIDKGTEKIGLKFTNSHFSFITKLTWITLLIPYRWLTLSRRNKGRYDHLLTKSSDWHILNARVIRDMWISNIRWVISN